MPRNSPAVERAISVLNFFAEHPQQSFTLSQIIKSMHLSRATGYGLMSTLVNNGYLFRNSDKSFVLGPALLAIGRNARQSFSALDVARLELRKLADELDVVAMAVADEGGGPVVRDHAASRNHLGWAPPPGSSYPLPHFGAFFGCNLSQGQLEEWLDGAQPPSAAERKSVLKTAAFIRTYGYTFAVSDDRAELVGGGVEPTRNPGRTITMLDPSASYELHCVEAPVVNERGVTTYVLALYRFSGAYSGEQVAAIGARLLESCRRVTTFMGGAPAAANFAMAR